MLYFLNYCIKELDGVRSVVLKLHLKVLLGIVIEIDSNRQEIVYNIHLIIAELLFELSAF